jgi:hypothetical protein
MSHHLDSELARQDPRLDATDFYVFDGIYGTAFVMNANPQSGDGGFHDEARYNIKIATNGGHEPDIMYRATFGPYEEEEAQSFNLERLTRTHRNGSFICKEVINDQTGRILRATDGSQVFAGAASEPFFIEPRVVSAAIESIAHGQPLDLDNFDPDDATNLFGNTNVHSLVVEVPDKVIGARSIKAWGTVELATDSGGWRQVQHVANPLVNTLFDFTTDNPDKDYNATPPHEQQVFAETIRRLTEAAVRANETVKNPQEHARHIAKLLLPDTLDYKTRTKANFSRGNGRNLVDPDAEWIINKILGTNIDMGLDASDATGEVRKHFPYVGSPVNL